MPTLSVNFSAESYKVLVQAKARIAARTGVELNWHDALLKIAKFFNDNTAVPSSPPRSEPSEDSLARKPPVRPVIRSKLNPRGGMSGRAVGPDSEAGRKAPNAIRNGLSRLPSETNRGC